MWFLLPARHLLLQCFSQVVFLNDRYVFIAYICRPFASLKIVFLLQNISVALESSSLGLNPGSTSQWLCGLEQIT